MLHTDDDFLTAITAQPADRTLRLVYADWLDERADPRAELVRVEEEMRDLPVFGDRFWELKPRRNELRALAGAEWCGRMRYGTECAPVFRHGIPDGWRERWRLIREFTERWHSVPMGDIGGRQAEIAEAEARLGRKLPPSVREWIAFAHDARQYPDWHNVWRDAYHLEVVAGQPALALLAQAEGDYYWGMPFAAFEQEDPLVRDYHPDLANDRYDLCVPVPDVFPYPSTTAFAISHGIGCTRGGGGFVLDGNSASRFLGIIALHFPPAASLDETALFEVDNVLMQVWARSWVRVEVFKPLVSDQLASLLFAWSRQSGSYHGMFVSDEDRRIRQ
ncbi:MAG: TIGR02996 domain-containing protein [Planctomycetes bacterium]|nr:TIGR02996 domain-containing protein [Planctomycetota bacterium]